MKDKKQFFIPKNYDKKFEWIPGISGWQHLAFLPVIAIDYFIVLHLPIDFTNKIVITITSLGIPYMLIGQHPKRDNVSLYKHIWWQIQFLMRQRKFEYKKGGYHYETIQSEDKGTKARRAVEKDNSGLDTSKSSRKRIAHHSKQQGYSASKGISLKFRANEQRRM